MPERKKKVVSDLEYRNCKIQVLERDVGHELHIDGKTTPAQRDADTGAYVSPEAPYQSFGTLEDLAKAIVDRRNETA